MEDMASFAQIGITDGLPSSVHTEVTILGAMLLDGMAIIDATARLTADDFSLDSHRRIYQSIVDLMGVGHGVDITTVRAELERKRELDSIGGPAYLAYLTEGIPRNLNIESYVRIIKDKSLLRRLMAIFSDGATRASDQSEDAINVLGDVHGGAGEQALEFYGEIAAAMDAGRTLEEAASSRLDRFFAETKGYVPGFGHRFHPVDPRAPRLLELTREFAARGVVGGRFADIAEALEAEIARRKGKRIPLNIDGATAVIYAELGFPAPLARGLFCLSRSVGILAHAWEQSQQAGRTKGPIPREYLWTYDGPAQRAVPAGKD